MPYSFSFLRRAIAGLAVTAGMAAAAETDSRFSDAEFEAAEILPMAARGRAENVKTAYLWVYRSALGTQLQGREPRAEEQAELRRLCKAMHAKARAVQPGGFDGYAIELAHGTGDTSRLSPKRRVVFFFWEARGRCDGAPSRGRIQ